MAAGAPFDSIQFSCEWHEQCIAGLRNATTENDHLGVEEVDA
jgi:hypothetical protein